MRGLIAAMLALPLAGCFHEEEKTAESRAIAYCEELVQLFIRSPSTYSRFDAYAFETKGSLRPSGPPHPGALDVSLSFDAANAYGTPVRHRAKCQFAVLIGESLELAGLTVEDEAVSDRDMGPLKGIVSLKEIDFRYSKR